jgi:hypothetical protein
MPHDANVVSPDANWKGDNNGEHVGRDETARPFSARLPRWGRGERGGGHPRRLRRQCNEHARTGGQADDGPGCGKQRGAHDGSEQRLRRADDRARHYRYDRADCGRRGDLRQHNRVGGSADHGGE